MTDYLLRVAGEDLEIHDDHAYVHESAVDGVNMHPFPIVAVLPDDVGVSHYLTDEQQSDLSWEESTKRNRDTWQLVRDIKAAALAGRSITLTPYHAALITELVEGEWGMQ